MEISLDLRLPRDAHSVPVIRQLLDASLGVLGVDGAIREDIQLMLTEACTNVIRHADHTDDYSVRAQIVDERCRIKVIDEGRGFDAANMPSPDGDLSEHGRGLTIMRALADDVRFDTLPEHGALVAMEKKLHYSEDAVGRYLVDGE